MKVAMPFQYNSNHTLIPSSKTNRQNLTDVERILWYYLRDRRFHGYKFRRQYPVNNYILDFYCIEKKLAVELDGSQHIEQANYDEKRTNQLKHLGIQVVRFWDDDILQNIEGVLDQVLCSLSENFRKETSL